MNKYLFEPYYWGLTEAAQQKLAELENGGMDRDLAFALLEKTWPETELYDESILLEE